MASGGGNTKYVVVGLLLLGAAGALFAWVQSQKSQERAQPPPPPPRSVERTVALAEPQFELEVEEEPEPPPPPEPVRKKRRRPRKDFWACSGDMPRQQVKKVLTSRNRSRVRTCYERRLKVNNALQGTIALRLRVDAGGRVAATQASGSLRDNEVFSCVRNLAKEWQFPPPEGGDCAVVAVPFNFTPKL